MEIILIDKIKSYLSTNRSVTVDYTPIHKGCDICLDKDHFLDDYDFYREHFGNWYYEELSDFLASNGAFGDSIFVDFTLLGDFLIANITLFCSDDSYNNDWGERHTKDEILTPTIVDAMIKHLKLDQSAFDEELISFNLVFDTDFQEFEVYYDDESLILSSSENDFIKSEIKQVISGWDGPFFGDDFSDLKTEITIERGSDEFVCSNTAEYEYKIEA
jgi:hypothetical protein